MITIEKASSEHFDELINIWESSVRATHDFLSESDINQLRKDIRQLYLPALPVYIAKDSHNMIHGFLGVIDNKIEMLFISAQSRGQGTGKILINFALTQLGANELDVNEQNPLGVGFYLHMGFEQIGRTEFDGQGNPFPLLKMKYKEENEEKNKTS